MVLTPAVRWRTKVLVGVLFSAMLLTYAWQRQVAEAQVTEVTGSAFGYYVNVGLFGGPQMVRGFGQPADAPAEAESPSVELPPGGSATPITDTDPDGATAQYGPAVIFDAVSMAVSTEGTTGPDGSVTSTATVQRDPNQAEQNDPYNADTTRSSCTADASGVAGATELINASLVLSTDPVSQEPVETIEIPDNPAPNTEHTGTIDHVGDRFRVVFNEQIVDGDTITVNAVHLFLLGEIAVGDFVIAQSVCGVTASGSGQPDGATTTTAAQPGGDGSGVTTTTAGGGSTATTVPRSGPAPTTPSQPRFTG